MEIGWGKTCYFIETASQRPRWEAILIVNHPLPPP